MLFIGKDRVDKDVESFKEANMTPEQLEKKKAKEKAEQEKNAAKLEEWTWKDTLAMTIAVFQILLPIMLIMAVVAVAVFGFFYFMAHN